MNTGAKGARGERRCIKLLEAAGYACTRAAGSLGLFDVIAVGADGVRCIQVKTGGERLSPLERQRLQGLAGAGDVHEGVLVLSRSLSRSDCRSVVIVKSIKDFDHSGG